MNVNRDCVRGVIFGQAVGDSLGLPYEYRSSAAIAKMVPGPFDDPDFWLRYQAVDRNVFGYREVWKPGEYSDDTEMALCVLDAYLATGGININVAERFQNWLATTTRGAGRLTKRVLHDSEYLKDPWAVAAKAWSESPSKTPPNGAVMRTSYVGILRPWDIDWTFQAAVDVARLTHADPRCVASAVFVSIVIARLVTGSTLTEAVLVASMRAKNLDAGFTDAMKFVIRDPNNRSIDKLLLDEGLDTGIKDAPVGHTYKATSAGFWALTNVDSIFGSLRGALPSEKFLRTLVAVICAGGDTDTNGAITGAMLGAYLGATRIPNQLVTGLYEATALDLRVDALLATYPA